MQPLRASYILLKFGELRLTYDWDIGAFFWPPSHFLTTLAFSSLSCCSRGGHITKLSQTVTPLEVSQIWKYNKNLGSLPPPKTWGQKTAYFGQCNSTTYKREYLQEKKWATNKWRHNCKATKSPLFLSQYGKLLSTNAWNYMAFYLLSRSKCSHGGHRTQVNPLSHMFEREPDLKLTSKILWFPPLKRGTKKWWFGVVLKFHGDIAATSRISSGGNALHINGKTAEITGVYKLWAAWRHNDPLCYMSGFFLKHNVQNSKLSLTDFCCLFTFPPVSAGKTNKSHEKNILMQCLLYFSFSPTAKMA